MNKALLTFLLFSILLYSCAKSKDQVELPEFRALVGVWASYNDTTIVSLSAVGHLNKVTILKSPRHSVFSGFSTDPVGGITYKYLPQINFRGIDTVMFKSSEPLLKQTVISTLLIPIRP